MMPAPMIAATAAPAALDVVERGERDLRVCGFGSQLDGDLGDDGEQPFGAV